MQKTLLCAMWDIGVVGKKQIKLVKAQIGGSEHLSALPPLGYVFLSKSLSQSQIPHLKNEKNNRIDFVGLL